MNHVEPVPVANQEKILHECILSFFVNSQKRVLLDHALAKSSSGVHVSPNDTTLYAFCDVSKSAYTGVIILHC